MSSHPLNLKNILFSLFFALLFTSNSLAAANSALQPPDEMLKKATVDMLRSINTHRAEIKKKPEKLQSLVEEIILPHLDFITASKIVMGKYWRRASKDQKIRFIRQFRTLLLRFYSSALAEYLSGKNNDLADDLIRYYPLKMTGEDGPITVRAEVQVENGQPIPIHYRLHKTRKGWKIFDVSVEGVSMITTYKNNFASQLKTEGIDAMIASLEEKNRQMLVKNKTK